MPVETMTYMLVQVVPPVDGDNAVSFWAYHAECIPSRYRSAEMISSKNIHGVMCVGCGDSVTGPQKNGMAWHNGSLVYEG